MPADLVDNARIQEDRRAHDRFVTDRRKADRAKVDAKATLTSEAQGGVEGHLYNLSASGCSIRLPAPAFALGDAVLFSIDSTHRVRGTVRWVRQNAVGVEFDCPFQQAFFDNLAQSDEPVTISRAA